MSRLVDVSAWTKLAFESANDGAGLAIWTWAPKKASMPWKRDSARWFDAWRDF